jgi:hypothetical protein
MDERAWHILSNLTKGGLTAYMSDLVCGAKKEKMMMEKFGTCTGG